MPSYWAIRGLQHPVRYLCEFLGLKYKDTRYQAGPPPLSDRSAWTDVKESMGMDFPNLPYVVHGDVKLSQSNTILRYVASLTPGGRRLLGTSLEEAAKIDELLNVLMDLRNTIVRCAYGTYPEGLPAMVSSATMFLTRIEKMMKGPFLFGSSPRLPDFVMYELVYQLNLMAPADFPAAKFPKVSAQQAAFKALPAIASYMASDRHFDAPVNNPSAKFNP